MYLEARNACGTPAYLVTDVIAMRAIRAGLDEVVALGARQPGARMVYLVQVLDAAKANRLAKRGAMGKG